MESISLTIPKAPLLPTTLRSPAADPEEQDPTNLSYKSHSTNTKNHNNGTPTEADIRALLRAGAPPPGVDTSSGQQGDPQDEDPMMRLLQQFMGNLSGEGQAGSPEGLPPALAAMLGGGTTPGQEPQQSGTSPATSAYIWRILHAMSALLLGIYLSTHVTFASTARLKDPRSTAPTLISPGGGEVAGTDMFWIFAITELVLQGSRMVLESGKGQEMPGWLAMVGTVLPEPWKGWIRLALRYRGIWSTLVEDSMVVLFVLGLVGWWKGFGG